MSYGGKSECNIEGAVWRRRPHLRIKWVISDILSLVKPYGRVRVVLAMSHRLSYPTGASIPLEMVDNLRQLTSLPYSNFEDEAVEEVNSHSHSHVSVYNIIHPCYWQCQVIVNRFNNIRLFHNDREWGYTPRYATP
eukprot:sb/3474631/